MFTYLIIVMCLCSVGAAGGLLCAGYSDEPEARVVGGWNAVTCLLAVIGLAMCLAEVS